VCFIKTPQVAYCVPFSNLYNQYLQDLIQSSVTIVTSINLYLYRNQVITDPSLKTPFTVYGLLLEVLFMAPTGETNNYS
jgi:hypothetical protein